MKTKFFLVLIVLVFVITGCAHEHTYGEWIVTKEATCTEDGVRERSCEKNDDSQTETIPATGHEFGEWEVVSDPTCQAEGEQRRICSKCGEEESETISIVEHSFSDWETTKEATCTEDGEQTRTCQICGMEEKETIPATGHDFREATTITPRTCNNCGETEGEALATVVKIGDECKEEGYSFVVSNIYFTTQVLEDHGDETYRSPIDSYCVIELSFTNLANETFEQGYSNRASQMSLFFDENTYQGESWTLGNSDDIIPLETQNLYILFTIPEQVEKEESKPIIATFALDDVLYATIIREGDGTIPQGVFDTEKVEDSDPESLSHTDGEEDYIYITQPAEDCEGLTQEDLDEGEWYTAATLNEDGSVTYKLTVEEHERWKRDYTESADQNLRKITFWQDYPINKIEHNDDFTEFNVYLMSDSIGWSQLLESYYQMLAEMYAPIIEQEKPDTIIVNYYTSSGELIE